MYAACYMRVITRAQAHRNPGKKSRRSGPYSGRAEVAHPALIALVVGAVDRRGDVRQRTLKVVAPHRRVCERARLVERAQLGLPARAAVDDLRRLRSRFKAILTRHATILALALVATRLLACSARASSPRARAPSSARRTDASAASRQTDLTEMTRRIRSGRLHHHGTWWRCRAALGVGGVTTTSSRRARERRSRRTDAMSAPE